MEKRITVEELRDKFNDLIEDGFGGKFIGVGEYYLGSIINTDDDGWNSIYISSIYFEDIPLTKEQQNYLDDEFKKDQKIFASLKNISF